MGIRSAISSNMACQDVFGGVGAGDRGGDAPHQGGKLPLPSHDGGGEYLLHPAGYPVDGQGFTPKAPDTRQLYATGRRALGGRPGLGARRTA